MDNLKANLRDTLSHLQEHLQEKVSQAGTIHKQYNMTEKHRIFLVRQSVLSIYAAWEGFLKGTLESYLQELNKLALSHDELSEAYLAFQTDNICSFKSIKTNQKVIRKTSVRLLEMYRKNVYFSTKINTESNANLKVTNNLLNRLSLQELPDDHEKRV
ncbi:MAG: hypothetical protein BECKG1743D_GA0114223_111132 [Candidatus Kentron sp. G]|nr:MAG: hypothetical protein BECKG1743F_GA0114225_110872 [Candidatus Kentron sp. G]VFN07095.1 MAG: hypothetical protein BECKG1743E_GA0114224_111322 [Candidatus Kentron sp. G]VFN07632.1 MAG: hypothetical protein BECKG1743D_GA0114223_111132 [Candidatus Kentron sp. G]